MSPVDLATVRDRIAAYDPDIVTDGVVADGSNARRFAATALILLEDQPESPEILFIERATRHGDRWSGQMALPGGRYEHGDPDLSATAVRETAEEVGVTLADPIGRLDDLHGRAHDGVVATYVFTLDHRPEVTPQPSEVASALWIPVSHLLAVENSVRYRYKGMGPFAGLEFEGRTVWGLTHRTLTGFFDILDLEIPRPRGFLLG